MANSLIYLAADHGGFEYKNKLVDFLQENNFDVEDLGPAALNPQDDYPDYAFALAEKVAGNPETLGIMFCRGGQGMAIAANKVKDVRAVVCWDKQGAADSKNDNDANVLSLPANHLSWKETQDIILVWLNTPYSAEERHVRRIQKISDYEQ